MGSQKQAFMWLSWLLFVNIFHLSRADVHHYDFFLQEWFYQFLLPGEWFRQELTEANQTIAPGQADAYTINGHPGETNGCSNDTTFEYQVDYQDLYLVRVINAVDETMVFGIAYHSFTIVGQSGAYSRRSFTNSLTLAPRQVVDVLLCANQNLGHYYITARPSSATTHTTTGILRYIYHHQCLI